MTENGYSPSLSPPRVTVVMPVLNEAEYIGRALDSLLVAARSVESCEIIVVDGHSEDGTREIVAEKGQRGTLVRLLDNPKRTVPHAMNIGIREATGDVLIRVDGHAEVDPDFIAANLEQLAAHPECACVGGPIRNVDLSELSAAISAAMSSRFGVGNARFRTGGADGYVDTVAFGAYRKADLLAIGLFDEDLVRNQDDELNYRLLKAGRKIWFSNKIRSSYYVRASLGKLFRQYFQYGYWKVYVSRKHGTITSLRQLVPPLLLLALVSLLLVGLFWHQALLLLLAVLALYLGAAALFAVRASGWTVRALRVVASFATLHGSYGLGYLAGVRDFVALRRGPSARSAELSR